MVKPKIKRGDVLLVNLEPVIGSEQGKIRPVVVVQNNISNEYSPTIIIAPITSKIYSKEFPTNVQLFAEDSGLKKESTILLNQIRTIDKSRIIKNLSKLNIEIMKRVDLAIKASFGLE